MKFKIKLLIILSLNACSSKSEKHTEEKPSSQNNTSNSSYESYESNTSNYSVEQISEEKSNDNVSYSSDCKFEDGTYSASVDYNNSETGYSATYTLDVEVQDCQVIQINFPNDGYLDSDHISSADIDENGNAFVEGEDGKTYEIQIDY
jgi:hypothetical protein